MMSALNTQVAGSHYKDKAIQPVEYIHANKLGFCEGNVVKYVTRWKEKDGMADLLKAKHYIELLIELEKKAMPDPFTAPDKIITSTDHGGVAYATAGHVSFAMNSEGVTLGRGWSNAEGKPFDPWSKA